MSESNHASNVIDMSQFATKGATLGADLMQQVPELSIGILKKLTRNMLDKADDALFELSNKAGSDATQQLYFDAMRDIRLKRISIENGFIKVLQVAFERFAAGKSLGVGVQQSDDAADELGLALVDDSDMEESIAISNMAEKMERVHTQAIFEITSRLEALYQLRNLQQKEHPLSPAVVANAFGDTLKPLGADFNVKLIIYKLFDKYVMSEIGLVFNEINALLVKNGILPKLKRTICKTNAFYSSHSSSTQSRGSYIPSETTVPEGWQHPMAVFGFSENGLAGFTPILAPGVGIVGTLSELQGYIVENGYPTDVTPSELGTQVINFSRQIHGNNVNDTTMMVEKIINMVSMIFDYIIEDRNIPSPIKAMLSRLQIPYLKVALTDDSFLSRKSHPARLLLNKMSQASLGWDGNTEQGSLYAMIGAIITETLLKYEENVNVFVDLCKKFDNFMLTEEARNKVFEERTQKTTEGKERVQYVKNRVDAWVEMWASREESPKLISVFLRYRWKSVMLYLMHKYGEDSRPWKYSVKLISCLLWSVMPKNTQDEGLQLIKVLPHLLRGLNKGMMLASVHPTHIAQFFEELARYHTDAIRACFEHQYDSGYDSREEMASVATTTVDQVQEERVSPETTIEQLLISTYEGLPPADSETDTVDVDDETLQKDDAALGEVVEEIVLESPQTAQAVDEVQDEFSEQSANIECGEWVEFTNDEGEPVRAKLAWKSSLTGSRLFVGRNGMKYAEKTLPGLAAEFRSGRARLLETIPVLDRAINRVIQSAAG